MEMENQYIGSIRQAIQDKAPAVRPITSKESKKISSLQYHLTFLAFVILEINNRFWAYP